MLNYFFFCQIGQPGFPGRKGGIVRQIKYTETGFIRTRMGHAKVSALSVGPSLKVGSQLSVAQLANIKTEEFNFTERFLIP